MGNSSESQTASPNDDSQCLQQIKSTMKIVHAIFDG